MKSTSKLIAAAAAAFTLAVGATARVTIETVTVGNINNTADTSGYGAVAYS